MKKHIKAISYCKDYGLHPILGNLFIGKLLVKERKTILTNLKKIFTKKTDKVFSGVFCESCFNNLEQPIKNTVPILPAFKIIS
ncbi:MAG: hypothetical protein V4439_04370 [Patescibacteria group bacterium]